MLRPATDEQIAAWLNYGWSYTTLEMVESLVARIERDRICIATLEAQLRNLTKTKKAKR